MKRHNGLPMRILIIPSESDIPYTTTRPTDTIASVGGPTEYVAALQANILKREQDIKDAEKNKVKIENYLLEEILFMLQTIGAVTENRLMREFQTTKNVIHNVCNLLLKSKLINRKRNTRGIWIYMKVT